jgi:hypothetical protein
MSTLGSSANLSSALKELIARSRETEVHWHDAKRQEFQRHYLEQLPHDVARAISVIEEIDALLKKVRRDCE